MADTVGAPDELGEKLSIEEYKSCRDLIAKNIDIIEKTEVYAVGASAAVAVFSLTQVDRMVCMTASYLPLAISIIGLVRFFGIDSTIDKINSYLVCIEKRHPDNMGWTQFYRAANRPKWLKWSRYLIWMILIILSVVLIYVAAMAPLRGR